MAEQASSTAIVPAPTGEYQINITDFTASGTTNRFAIAVPNSVTAKEASVMLRAGILKAGAWKDKAFPVILHAVIYADNYGLDIMAGDVYMASEGRLSTTAGAKIKHAMASGKIEGYEVEITEGQEISIPYTTANKDYTWKGKELTAKVTVRVKGWTTPITYSAKLSEWFVGRNPNWREKPGYMLRKNALSKALEEVAPLGTEAEDAPPVEQPAFKAYPQTTIVPPYYPGALHMSNSEVIVEGVKE